MGRTAWMVTAVAMVAGIVWGWMVLPETGVPMKSDFDGTVTEYGTRTAFIGMFAGLSLLMLVIMPLISLASLKGDASFLNMPNKDYWLAPERAEATKADIAAQMWWFLAATNALLVTGLSDTILQATTGRTVIPFALVFVAYMIYTVGWTIRLQRSYRLPDQ